MVPAVRKRPEDRSASWKPKRSVRLYLDDIDELLAIARTISPTATAYTREFTGITDAMEMQDFRPADTADFGVSTGDPLPEFLVDLTDGQVKVWIASRDRMELKGALTEASSVLTRCERKLLGAWGGDLQTLLSTFLIISVAASVGISVVAVRIAGYSQDEWPAWRLLLLVGFVVLAFIGWTAFGRAPDPSVQIVTSRRADAPSWWLQNRTAVLIGLATNVVVAIAFYFLGSGAGS